MLYPSLLLARPFLLTLTNFLPTKEGSASPLFCLSMDWPHKNHRETPFLIKKLAASPSFLLSMDWLMPPLWLGPFCQISNLTSRLLAHAFRHISGTFYLLPAQPVVHSPELTTSSRLSPQFGHFYPVPTQPVVHSKEWTTGSGILPCMSPFPHTKKPLSSGQGRCHLSFWR